jgi:phosphoenolpyruvate---glycerone phosphotransferase subunit DhaL
VGCSLRHTVLDCVLNHWSVSDEPENMEPKLFITMLRGAIAKVREGNSRLSALDSAAGDGDHGTTMLRAMGVLEKVIAESETRRLPELLSEMGWGLLGVDGGASGPLLGSLFLGMSEAVGDAQQFDANTLAAMFEAGLSSLRKQTKAQVGDKTLIDALEPAVAELRATAAQGSSIPECFEKAAQAAQKGAASTCNLVAKFGRAKYLGPRTVGTQDPGATSIALIFEGFCDALGKKESISHG